MGYFPHQVSGTIKRSVGVEDVNGHSHEGGERVAWVCERAVRENGLRRRWLGRVFPEWEFECVVVRFIIPIRLGGGWR